MNFKIVLLMAFFSITAYSFTLENSQNSDLTFISSKGKCEISLEERESILNVDYQNFDQKLPDGGWRKFEGCWELARDLIDAYVKRHFEILTENQLNVLTWHGGQLSAFLNDDENAIVRMRKTLKKDVKEDLGFLWNHYVLATISFLQKDKKTLIKERRKLSKGSSPFNHINLRIVDSFIRCFNASYIDAYSLSCDVKETNKDKIQSLGIKFSLKENFPIGIINFIEQKKLIVLGEIHGTKEVPDLFGKFISLVANKNKKILVALEITQSSQSAVNNFLKNRDEKELKNDNFFSRKYQDGRSSEAMVDLLKKLATFENITVLCMDPRETINSQMTGQERDTIMAKFIANNIEQYEKTFVLAGNIHTSSAVGTPWEEDFRPMAYELKSMLTHLPENKFLNILVRHERVNAWTCQGNEVERCTARYGETISSDYSEAFKWNTYFLLESPVANGHNGTIFIRSTAVSFPFIRE
jgi:hypothetical protein